MSYMIPQGEKIRFAQAYNLVVELFARQAERDKERSIVSCINEENAELVLNKAVFHAKMLRKGEDMYRKFLEEQLEIERSELAKFGGGINI